MKKKSLILFVSALFVFVSATFAVFVVKEKFLEKSSYQGDSLFSSLRKARKESNETLFDLSDVLTNYIAVGDDKSEVLRLLEENKFSIHKIQSDKNEGSGEEIFAQRKDANGIMYFDFYELKISFQENKVSDLSARVVFRGP